MAGRRQGRVMTEDVGDDSGFLNRWSARKRRLSQQTNDTRDTHVPDASDIHESDIDESDIDESDIDESDIDEQQAAASVELEAKSESGEAPLLTDADMPPVESLTADSDMSAFFNRGVSAVLRKAALRHVFHQPAYNVRDGLNDYDGDYTVFEPLGDTITSDMKWHTARKERERLEAQAREEEKREQQRLEEEQHAALEESCAEGDSQDTEDQVIDDQYAEDQVTDDQYADAQEADAQEADSELSKLSSDAELNERDT
ncbi:DUF3306 domain-containing protein [bacterium]|nr:DUF3306 domain-containing protein [bacterium]